MLQLFPAPTRRFFSLGLLALLFLCFVGRLLTLGRSGHEGFTWNLIALFITTGLFFVPASHFSGLAQMGTPPTRWGASAFLWSFLVSSLLSLTSIISIAIAERKEEYYPFSDPFVVLPGYQWTPIPSSGDFMVPYYSVPLDISMQFLTFLVFFALFFMTAWIGIALGTTYSGSNIRVMALVILAAILALFTVMFLINHFVYNQGYRISAPIPGVFIHAIPVTLISMTVAHWFSRRAVQR